MRQIVSLDSADHTVEWLKKPYQGVRCSVFGHGLFRGNTSKTRGDNDVAARFQKYPPDV